MKQIIVLTFTLTTFSFCQAQQISALYYGVSSDSLYIGHQLEFKTDTTLEISTFPRHMSQRFKITLNYQRTGKTLTIFNENISKLDSIALANQGLKQFSNQTTFTIDNKAIFDMSSKIVYLLYKDFQKKCYLTYLIDGKAYKQETGLSDAYGLTKNNPKDNKALEQKLASIKDDIKHYSVSVYKGLDAYKKYGYESVFGVIELNRKD